MNNSIAFHIFLIIIGVSILLTISIVSLRTYLDYGNISASIEEDIKQIVKSNSIGIADSLWVMDSHDIQVYLEGLLNHPYIEHISIHKEEQVISFAGAIKSKQVIQRDFRFYHTYNNKQVYLGTLSITAGLDEAHKDLINSILTRLFYDGISILLIALFMFIIVYIIVTERLSTVAQYVARIKAVEAGDPLIIRKRLFHRTRDELDHVVTAINTMNANLRTAFQE